jgi:flagellar biosynthetic protein FlhB
MADDMGERTEAPTGRRLQEARTQGNVARSQDLVAAVDLIGSFILLTLFGASMARATFIMLRATLEAQDTPTTSSLFELGKSILVQVGLAALPFLLLACAVAALAHIMQFGLIWNTSALAPKFERLNPFTGFGKLFNKRNAAKTTVNSVKLVIVTFVAWNFARSCAGTVASLPMLTAIGGWGMIGKLAAELAAWLFAVMLVMGAADFAFQKWNHLQELKMTKQDVKDERRSMEGDPQIKGKRFRMARDIIRQRLGSAVPKADVVVTNPTHYSVAIAYDQKTMSAPRVVAKGADELAMKIRYLARQHGVPVLERPPLARALFRHVEVGQEVHAQYYEAVAEVLAYVYRLEKDASSAAPTLASPAAA